MKSATRQQVGRLAKKLFHLRQKKSELEQQIKEVADMLNDLLLDGDAVSVGGFICSKTVRAYPKFDVFYIKGVLGRRFVNVVTVSAMKLKEAVGAERYDELTADDSTRISFIPVINVRKGK